MFRDELQTGRELPDLMDEPAEPAGQIQMSFMSFWRGLPFVGNPRWTVNGTGRWKHAVRSLMQCHRRVVANDWSDHSFAPPLARTPVSGSATSCLKTFQD